MEQNRLIRVLIIVIIIASILFGLRVILLKDVDFFAFLQGRTMDTANNSELKYDNDLGNIKFEDSSIITTDSVMSNLIGILIMFAIIYIVYIIGLWRIFSKCGYPGWHAIIPILNMITMLKVVGLSRMDDIIILNTIYWNNYSSNY
ncbi:MAG: hypothetical protein HFJ40_01375 [Clostridia bacterium]|nr:hypothetical protein [Clostridia bacterium]